MFSGSVFSIDLPPLDEVSAVRLLADLGELDMETVHAGDVTVVDESRRCRCLIVRTTDRGWAIKQGANSETRESIANEALFYKLLRNTGFVQHMPRYVFDDPNSGLLVVHYVDGETLREANHEQAQAERAHLAVRLGEALAQLHLLAESEMLPAKPAPRILGCGRATLESLEFHSGASLNVIRIIQSHPNLRAALEEVAAAWSATAVTHNDLRSDNVLVDQAGALSLIDWEMAGWGDRRWDLAALLSERIVWWMNDPDLWTPATPEPVPNTAARGLADLHVFAQALLAGYAKAYSGAATLAGADVPDLMSWCAARLVQFAIENSHREALLSAMSEQLLQIAANIFAHPERAARIFFGLEV